MKGFLGICVAFVAFSWFITCWMPFWLIDVSKQIPTEWIVWGLQMVMWALAPLAIAACVCVVMTALYGLRELLKMLP